jgi:hypothetical protein
MAGQPRADSQQQNSSAEHHVQQWGEWVCAVCGQWLSGGPLQPCQLCAWCSVGSCVGSACGSRIVEVIFVVFIYLICQLENLVSLREVDRGYFNSLMSNSTRVILHSIWNPVKY